MVLCTTFISISRCEIVNKVQYNEFNCVFVIHFKKGLPAIIIIHIIKGNIIYTQRFAVHKTPLAYTISSALAQDQVKMVQV